MKFFLPKIFILVIALCYAPLSHSAAEQAFPILNWTSANEEGVYGYIIYRANSPSGPFVRINARIVSKIAAAVRSPTSAAPASSNYRYVDESAKPDTSYYYYIDAISVRGLVQRLTGIVHKAPMSARAEE